MSPSLADKVLDMNFNTARPVPLELSPEDIEFLLKATGIAKVDVLKTHVLRIQNDAAKVYPYPCILRFDFAKLNVSTVPNYQRVLRLGQVRRDALFLDLGCAFGTDIRKLLQDGYPAQNVIASDLRPEFWNIGHKLFRSTADTFSVKFIPGNILHDDFVGTEDTSGAATPSIDSLTTLAPLRGKISVIHTSKFFHLFSETEQLAIARTLSALLSPEPGSMIVGAHISRPEKGFRVEAPPPAPGYIGNRMFCHSVESWTELWEGIFGKGKVAVDAELVEYARSDLIVKDPSTKFYMLNWCVTRL